MDTSETYIKMCDCPEIQEQWKPKIGDFMVRMYTIFGEELDKKIWPEMQPEICVINSYSKCDSYYHCVNEDGETRIYKHPADINKETCIWIPRSDQTIKMIEENKSGVSLLMILWEWVKNYDGGAPVYTSKEWNLWTFDQLLLAFYMKKKHNKVWNGESWERVD